MKKLIKLTLSALMIVSLLSFSNYGSGACSPNNDLAELIFQHL